WKRQCLIATTQALRAMNSSRDEAGIRQTEATPRNPRSPAQPAASQRPDRILAFIVAETPSKTLTDENGHNLQSSHGGNSTISAERSDRARTQRRDTFARTSTS